MPNGKYSVRSVCVCESERGGKKVDAQCSLGGRANFFLFSRFFFAREPGHAGTRAHGVSFHRKYQSKRQQTQFFSANNSQHDEIKIFSLLEA